MKLRKPMKIVLNAKGAHAVIEWICGKIDTEEKDFTKADIGFAQAALVKMLDQSFEEGLTDDVRRKAARLSSADKRVIAVFLRTGGKNLVNYPDKEALDEMIKAPLITRANRQVLIRYCTPRWTAREKTGEIRY